MDGCGSRVHTVSTNHQMIEIDLNHAFRVECYSTIYKLMTYCSYMHSATRNTTTLQVLSDENMRARYDQFGEAGLGGMCGWSIVVE